MEQSHSLTKSSLPCNQAKHEHEEEEHRRKIYQQFQDLVSPLPTVKGCSLTELRCYDGCYLHTDIVVGFMAVKKLFQARDTDIIITSLPKTGTTWIKALLFATINRNCPNKYSNALAALSPHECVPFLEIQLYGANRESLTWTCCPPRDFFPPMSRSICYPTPSGCRIIYLCRNPKDVFVSNWHFASKIKESYGITEPPSIEDDFELFCKGHSAYGPFWDHITRYWKASLQVGKYNILFMRYEELINDPVTEVKRLAEFVGHPFTVDEEKNGMVPWWKAS